jgi:hypothetical protein
LISDIVELKQSKELPYFIPGSSSGSAAKRLSAIALVGQHLSTSFETRLEDTIQKNKNCQWLSLYPRECTSLAATIRLLLARVRMQSKAVEGDATSLSNLSFLPSSQTVFINLSLITLHRYAVLNDFVKALHSASQQRQFPRLILVFNLEGGVASLDDKLDSDSIRLLDMKRFNMPSPPLAFDVFIRELFLDSNNVPDVWFASSTLELLRFQYFERGFDLDKIISTIEVSLSEKQPNPVTPADSKCIS